MHDLREPEFIGGTGDWKGLQSRLLEHTRNYTVVNWNNGASIDYIQPGGSTRKPTTRWSAIYYSHLL